MEEVSEGKNGSTSAVARSKLIQTVLNDRGISQREWLLFAVCSVRLPVACPWAAPLARALGRSGPPVVRPNLASVL